MKKKLQRIGIAIFVCLLIGFLSGTATQTSVNSWYSVLKKPFFTPPSWLFGPVWTLLYIMMGVAAGIVWSRGFYHKWVKIALYHFGFQLILNAAWSIFFFGLQNPLIAFVDITALFILLIFTFKWFKVVNITAAYLLVPYIIWVAYAAILNLRIWQLN